MSFLYKALLKNNRQNASETSLHNPQQSSDSQTNGANAVPQDVRPSAALAGFDTPFAQPLKQSNNGLMWAVIAALLLVVGLLAGYIWGNKTGGVPQARVMPQLTSNSPQTQIAANEQVIQQPPITINQEPQASSIVTTPTDSPAPNKQQPVTETAAVAEDKHVAIAVDSQGQVVSKVTAPTNTDKTSVDQPNSTGTVLNNDQANQLDDEVALDNIPDSLKASFAEAVKATQTQSADLQQDALFAQDKLQYDSNSAPLNGQTKVSVASSLLDIHELSAEDSRILPVINYQMHIYSSLSQERWVKLNGMTLYEGDQLVNGLTLLEIRQNSIVWQTDVKRFSQQALDDYK